ncbi:MAG TPA: TonB-dependent receptor [Polyangiales bacterium]|nr:TonB-dependent receptor [Polyangiales bacterium]
MSRWTFVAALCLSQFWVGDALAQDAEDAGVPVEEPPTVEASAEDLEGVSEYRAVAIAPGATAAAGLDEVAGNAQRVTAADIADDHPNSAHDVLTKELSSVTINDAQNNPLQPELQYRGFTLSPLLGTPQGLAVYQNGVRLNEPFGDVLQWDLIPEFAIADLQLLPGANPVYGLNALGGSLVLRMKDGFRAPGYRIEASAGSFARTRAIAEYGTASGDWAAYAGAAWFGEQGFRDHSPSSALQAYADLRHRLPDREIGVSLTVARTDLQGNGPVPNELLHQDRSAVFTWPDITQNDLLMVEADARKKLSDTFALLGTAYLRHGHRSTLNADAAEFETCSTDSGDSVTCDEEGELLLDPTGRPIPATDPYDALLHTTETSSDAYGASLQLDQRAQLFDRPNQFVAGVSYAGAVSIFLQRAEAGYLTEDRTVQGDGVQIAGDEFATDLHVRDHNLGVYAAERFNIGDGFVLHLSGRLNWYQTHLDDPAGEALDGDHTFARFNPSVGVTYRVAQGWTLFASYGEANRAPSAAELACADPEEPCRVPNAFLSDPPLEQVVSRSVELGVRGRVGSDPRRPWLQTSLAAFGSRNQDDILFVAGERIGTGYFRNAGQTQRIGLEAAFSVDRGPLRFSASYTLLRATFESELDLPGDNHPSLDDDDDALHVEPGSRLPGLPLHSVRAELAVRPARGLELGIAARGQSDQPFRGDEANLLDGVGGWVILDAYASYALFPELELFVRGQNLLDTNYSTFGVLGDPSEVFPSYSDARFYGPGAPLAVWAGFVVTGPDVD